MVSDFYLQLFIFSGCILTFTAIFFQFIFQLFTTIYFFWWYFSFSPLLIFQVVFQLLTAIFFFTWYSIFYSYFFNLDLSFLQQFIYFPVIFQLHFCQVVFQIFRTTYFFQDAFHLIFAGGILVFFFFIIIQLLKVFSAFYDHFFKDLFPSFGSYHFS